MSVFDLFRGFFGIPGGHYRGRRDPFFDAMTRDDEDDEDDDEDGFHYDGFRGDHQDSALRFGFSFGLDGMKIQEPPSFGHVVKEMEEIFSQLGRWDGQPESGHFGVPSIMPPPPAEKGGGRSSGNPLRDFMLKSPDSDTRGWPSIKPRGDRQPLHASEERKEDRDLDSAVSSGGLDQILTPPAGQSPSQPRTRSFFQSVTVTKVVKPDGSVEERRTVRDGQGNEETTVTRSGGPGMLEGPAQQAGPALPGESHPFSDMRDDESLFSRFFGGFK
ncbi:HCLS1-associated protein X-1 [Parambassis ranga]|uniref:HCLS1-associated protein X-1 n=1 Tax=Parambassis ranga TaxID=210632 RepID=A0A6P7HZG3_9TELE|nr:HCLS1-associated protein X-1 [Parambassis ranga]